MDAYTFTTVSRHQYHRFNFHHRSFVISICTLTNFQFDGRSKLGFVYLKDVDQITNHNLILDFDKSAEKFPPSSDDIFPPPSILVPKGLWNYLHFTKFGSLKTINFPARKDVNTEVVLYSNFLQNNYSKPKSEQVRWKTICVTVNFEVSTSEKLVQLCRREGVTVGNMMILILSISGLRYALTYDTYPDVESRDIWFGKASVYFGK